MKVIVKDHLIDTSLIIKMTIWGECSVNPSTIDIGDEIAVYIEYYKYRLNDKHNDLIITGYEKKDTDLNIKAIDEARRIVDFIESHRTKLDYPRFD